MEPAYCGDALLDRMMDVFEAELVLHPDCFALFERAYNARLTAK
jgi:hypothetical protein